jgi:microcin C transport system permease protein
MKKLGVAFIILAIASYLGERSGLWIPIAKWVDIFSRSFSEFLRMLMSMLGATSSERVDTIFLNTARAALALTGLWLAFRPAGEPNPQTAQRWRRFRGMKLGYYSLCALGALLALAALDDLLVGKRALLVSYEGKLRSPALERQPVMGRDFGVEPSQTETDYRKLQGKFRAENKGNWVLMPVVPYDSKSDAEPVVQELTRKDGLLYGEDADAPFTGLAYTSFADNTELRRREYRVVDGKFHGETIGRDRDGVLIERLTYKEGAEVDRKALVEGIDTAALDAGVDGTLRQILYAPTPPSRKQRHYLGTDSSGNDVLAVAFGGFQMAVGTSIYYVPVVYLIGIVVGCLMGYFGGWVDLGGQRGLEIWGAIPFLFVVILVRSVLPNPTPLLVTTLLAAFGWLGIAAYMRTGAYREKTRDYVAAARLQGASTGRIIFNHVLPNSLATIVTLIPFTVDHLLFAMTSLDFLGFGLPAGSPTWGGMLADGTDNLAAPWILLTGFGSLVTVLVLVTFVGESIREAFDPKRFTTYR